MVSSLYCQTPGFIAESITNEQHKLMEFNPILDSKQKLLEDLRDVFDGDR